jgi:CRISPR-associated protein Csx16
MRAIFVTRHQGALDWAQRRGFGDARIVPHLDDPTLASLLPGDIVIGTLPVNLIADLNARGAEYWHLVLDVPREARGKDLSADDMERFGARIETYRAMRV